jgi:hypothetical protein
MGGLITGAHKRGQSFLEMNTRPQVGRLCDQKPASYQTTGAIAELDSALPVQGIQYQADYDTQDRSQQDRQQQELAVAFPKAGEGFVGAPHLPRVLPGKRADGNT